MKRASVDFVGRGHSGSDDRHGRPTSTGPVVYPLTFVTGTAIQLDASMTTRLRSDVRSVIARRRSTATRVQATFLYLSDVIDRRLTATADADSALDATKFASHGPVPAGGPAKVRSRVRSSRPIVPAPTTWGRLFGWGGVNSSFGVMARTLAGFWTPCIQNCHAGSGSVPRSVWNVSVPIATFVT